MAIEKVVVKYEADIKKLKSELKEARGSTQKLNTATKNTTKSVNGLGNGLKQVGSAIAVAFATERLIAFGKESVRLFDIQQKAESKVKQAIISTNKAAGLSFQELAKEASKLQKSTIFGDEQILNDATAQLLTFTNIAGNNFKRTQAAALDLATVLDGDLKSSSIQLGKALNDPVANLSALSRSGIQFSKEQKATIKTLVETNKLAEAQGVILEELERQYGGQAEAAAKAGTGGLKQFQNRIGDIQEVIGKLISKGVHPLLSLFTGVADRIDKFASRFDEVPKSLRETTTETTNFIEKGNSLIKTYETLTAKTNLTSDEKRKLAEVTNSLIGQFGSSVAIINKETGAITINTKAVIEQIRIKSVLNSENARQLLGQQLALETQLKSIESSKALLESFRVQSTEISNLNPLIDATADGMVALSIAIAKSEAAGVKFTESEKEQIKLLKQATTNIAFETTARKELDEVNRTLLASGIDLEALAKTNSESILKGTVKGIKENKDVVVDEFDLMYKSLIDEGLEIIYPKGSVNVKFEDDLDAFGIPIEEGLELNDKLFQEQFEKDKKRAEERIALEKRVQEEFISLAGSTKDTLFEFSRIESENELSLLNEQLKNKQISQEQFNQRSAQVKRNQAKADKDSALFDVFLSASTAIVKAIAESPGTFGLPFSAFATAQGALQIAAINARPLPKFARGKVDIAGEGTTTSDSILAMISKGESVINANETAKWKTHLLAMNSGHYDKFLNKHYIPKTRQAKREAGMSGFDDGRMLKAIKRNKTVYVENIGEIAGMFQKANKRGW